MRAMAGRHEFNLQYYQLGYDVGMSYDVPALERPPELSLREAAVLQRDGGFDEFLAAASGG